MIVTGIIIITVGFILAAINMAFLVRNAVRLDELNEKRMGTQFVLHAFCAVITVVGFAILAIGVYKEVS